MKWKDENCNLKFKAQSDCMKSLGVLLCSQREIENLKMNQKRRPCA